MAEIGASKISLDRSAISGGADIACREGGLEGRVILIDLGTGIDEQELLRKLRVADYIAPLEYLVVSLSSGSGVVNDLGGVGGIESRPGSGCSDRNPGNDLRDPVILLRCIRHQRHVVRIGFRD